MDLALITYKGWCAIKPNQTKPNQTIAQLIRAVEYTDCISAER